MDSTVSIQCFQTDYLSSLNVTKCSNVYTDDFLAGIFLTFRFLLLLVSGWILSNIFVLVKKTCLFYHQRQGILKAIDCYKRVLFFWTGSRNSQEKGVTGRQDEKQEPDWCGLIATKLFSLSLSFESMVKKKDDGRK